MNAAHTPGPWGMQEHSWSDTSITDSDGCRIAKLSICDIATEETQTKLESVMDANARLIAASPELLEALEAMIQRVSDLGANGFSQEVAKGKASIAKAKGGEG